MTTAEYLNSPRVQEGIKAAQIAWEGESPYAETDAERIALARGLMEMTVALAGLPNELDSIEPREAIYAAIVGSKSAVR